MEFGLRAGGDDGEHNAMDFVEISEIFAKHDAHFFGIAPFDKVYYAGWSLWSGLTSMLYHHDGSSYSYK